MKKISKSTLFISMETLNELSEIELELVNRAKEATAFSYSPYSNFKVGAALITDSNEIICGSNQENASYPLCMCAERVALYTHSMLVPEDKIVAMAITAISPGKIIDEPIPPCGACRQVIAEYEKRQHSPIRLILVSNTNNILIADGIKGFLPFDFNGDYLA